MLSGRSFHQLVVCLSIFVVSTGQSTSQSEREIRLHLAGEVPAVPLTLTVERVGGHTEAGGDPGTSHPWPAGAEATTLSLDDDTVWRLQLEGPDLWSPEVVVDLLGDDDPSAIDLLVFPTAPVRFAPQLPHGAELPAEGVTLGFQPVSERAPPEGVVPCAADDDGSLTCPVPVVPTLPGTRSDLKLRLPGYASHFVWARKVATDGIDLGPITFAPGASVVGRVEAESGSLPEDGVVVAVEPAGVPTPSPSPDDQRVALRGETVPLDERGFFQARGLAAGSYRVRVEAPGFAPLVTAPFDADAEDEVELAEPLLLERPLELAVLVNPAVDPDGEPWRLSLLSGVAGRAELLDRGRTDGAGRWTVKPLPAGQYHVLVMDGGGTRVAMEPVALAPGATDVLVALQTVAVEGTVRLGDDPLPRARVYFGGRSGAVSVRLEADDEGRFAGTLPRDGPWPVDIQAFGPTVARRLEVDVVPSDGPTRVDFDLPDTELSGEVVDGDGRPLENVTVLLASVQQRPVQTVTDDAGEFAFHGLEPGNYRAEALRATPEGTTASAEGEWVALDGDTAATVRLVLVERRRVPGLVTRRGGAAAGVQIEVQSETRPFVTGPVRSGPDGRFELDLPDGVDEVQITALVPGSALYHRTHRVAAPGEVVVALAPGPGGSLELPFDGAADRGTPRPVLRLDGGPPIGWNTLLRWAGLHGSTPGEDSLVVPALPVGTYELCAPATTDCSRGFLTAGGSLAL